MVEGARPPDRPQFATHKHRLQECHDCEAGMMFDGSICETCDGRGYLRPEFCSICGEPMGHRRRQWIRQGRPDPRTWSHGEEPTSE